MIISYYSDKETENSVVERLVECNQTYLKFGIISNFFPLISNLSVYENIALPAMFHKNLSNEEMIVKVQHYLDIFGEVSILHSRKDTLNNFQIMLVKYIQAVVTKTDIIVFVAQANQIAGEYEGKYIEFLSKINDNKIRIIDYIRYKDLYSNFIEIEEKNLDEWLIQDLKE